MPVAPVVLVRFLCIACLVLNTISICLCLSALFLLTLAYLDLGQALGELTPSQSVLKSTDHLFMLKNITDSHDYAQGIVNSSGGKNVTTTTTTTTPALSEESPALGQPTEEQFNLIIYLLFYLAAAILGTVGATTRYQRRRIYCLAGHVSLLASIIVFNLLAWLHFRTYSPLNYATTSTPFADGLEMLVASLFDCIDLAVGVALLVVLVLNRLAHVEYKHRNSISPMINET